MAGLRGSILSSIISAWLKSLLFCSHRYEKPIGCMLVHTAWCWMNSDSSQTLKKDSKGHHLFRKRSSLLVLYHRISSGIICWLNEPCLNLSFTLSCKLFLCCVNQHAGAHPFPQLVQMLLVLIPDMLQTHRYTLKMLLHTSLHLHNMSHILHALMNSKQGCTIAI